MLRLNVLQRFEDLKTQSKLLTVFALVGAIIAAMAGVGLSTSFKSMKGLGIKPFYVGFFAAILVGVVAFIMVLALGRFVQI